jgi:glutathione synthase/RimK-type ligase-like ATP-grasp enzyme
MKKIGILFGQENTFPQAFIERVNEKEGKKIIAEAVKIDKIIQAQPLDYAVIIDRISQDVPFYRAALKNAAICGTAVINNPFWWSADDKFFNNALAIKLGITVPKTVILPSNQHPNDTSSESFRNLSFPLDWQGMFDYVGFPAYFKPFAGGGWKHVYRVNNAGEFFAAYHGTGQLVMMLQEEIIFDSYFRCYCIGGNNVRIMQYEPRNPFHQRYVQGGGPVEKALLKKMEHIVIQLNQALGYDFNTVELAVRDGIPYPIDFCNPAPDADVNSVGQENFEWVVETAANVAIERAKAQKDGKDNLTWGTFVQQAVAPKITTKAGKKVVAKAKVAEKTVEKTTAATTKKATTTKKKATE